METYLSYQVINEIGDTIVNVVEEIPSDAFSILVTPEPAEDEITLHFTPAIDGEVSTKIIDESNAIVWEQGIIVAGDEAVIDITELEAGMYLVVCIHNADEAATTFVKYGIGSYEETNQATMQITVVPNPATGAITVSFPVSIDAVMNVKILDVMGMIYHESNPYVVGNNLSLDVSSLPAGMFYLVCTNNSGVATAKFFKQ